MRPTTLRLPMRFMPHPMLLALAGLLLLASPALAQQPDPGDIEGTWWTADDESKVKVFLSKAGTYSGKIVWLENATNDAGQPRVDEHNPDPKLRNEPLNGLLLMKGFRYSPEEQKWVDGTVYDPKNGKTYEGYVRLSESGDTLFLRGYVLGITWLGRTTEWRRAAD